MDKPDFGAKNENAKDSIRSVSVPIREQPSRSPLQESNPVQEPPGQEPPSEQCCLLRPQWGVCGLFTITRGDALALLALVADWAIIVFAVIPADSEEIVDSEEYNDIILGLLYPCSAIFLIVGIIMLKAAFSTFVLVMMALIFIVFPFIFLGIYIPVCITSGSTVNAELVLLMGFSLVCGGYWAIMRCLRNFCNRVSGGTVWGACVVLGCCYWVTILLVGLVAYGVIYYSSTGLQDGYKIKLRYLLSAFVFALWGAVQYTFLFQSYDEYRRSVQEAETLHEFQGLRRGGTILSEQQLRQMKQARQQGVVLTTQQKAIYFGNIAGNVALGICFSVAELYLIGEVQDNYKSEFWSLFSTEMFISLFIIVVMVVFIPLSASRLRHENKQLITTAFVAFLPFGILLPLYRLYVDDSDLSDLVKVLLVAIPCFALYLTTLNYANRKRGNIYLAYLTVSGFGFVLPCVLSFTLYYIDYYSLNDPLTLAGVVLFAVAMIMILVFLIVQLVWRIKEKIRLGIEFKNDNCVQLGVVVNSSGGIICMGILGYVYCTCPDIEDSLRSMIFAMCFFILFITVTLNLLLRLKVPKGTLSHNLDYLFSEKEDPLQTQYGQERMWQKIGVATGIVGLPVLLVILYCVISSDSAKYFFMAALGGSVILTFLFVTHLEIRRRIGIYAKNCLPLYTTCLWVFVIFPLLVGAPAAIAYLGTSDSDYQSISGGIISFLCVILMIGVTIMAIAVNYVFKQMEVEQKAKFCVKFLHERLSKIAVRGSEDVLRLLYDQYTLYGENVLVEALSKGSVVFWWPVADRDPDPKHNRILIDGDQYRKLKAIAEKSNKKAKDIMLIKPEEKKEKKSKRRYCCAFCYESDGEDDEEKRAIKSGVLPTAQVFPESAAAGLAPGIENDIIKDYNNEENVIDFRDIVDRLRREGMAGQDNYVNGLYIKPYNALMSDEDEELARGLEYQDYLDIVEDRNINSEKFLEVLRTQEGCLRRFYDLVFIAFSQDAASEDEVRRMFQDQFISFCVDADIIDRYGLTQDQVTKSKREYEDMFSNTASRHDNPMAVDRVVFDDLITEIAKEKYPGEGYTTAKNMLLAQRVYPGLFRTKPDLVNTRFARNVLNENYKPRNLYPQEKSSVADDDQNEVPFQDVPQRSERGRERRREKGACRRLCISINQSLNSIVDRIEKCFTKILKCIYRIIGCYTTEDKPEDGDKENGEDKNKVSGMISPLKARKMLPVADWPKIVETVLKGIKDGFECYKQKNEKLENVVNLNTANLSAIANEIYGAYVIASMAFDEEVGWGFSSLGTIIMSALKLNSTSDDSASSSTFIGMFWLSFALCIIYATIAIPAAHKARRGILGLGPDGKPAGLFTWDFMLSNLTNILGASMYISIIKNLLTVFACNYEVSPWTTYTVSGLTCWEGSHYAYAACALFAIFIYYPLATFMYPNLQFQDKLLDLKFHPPFLVMLSQVKLFMAGLSCFYTDTVHVILMFTGGAMFVMGVLCILMKPCLSTGANIWYAAEYFMIACTMGGGIIMYETQLKVFSLLFISIGDVAILVATYVYCRIKQKSNGLFICFNLCCKPSGAQTPDEAEKEIDHSEASRGHGSRRSC